MERSEAVKPNFKQILNSEEFKEQGFNMEEASDSPELYAPIQFDGFEIDGDNNAQFLKRVLEKAAAICRNYAKGIVIHDTYGNKHDARREWRSQMDNRYPGFEKWYQEVNKMRANNISGVTGHLFALSETLRVLNIESPKALAIRQLEKDLPHEQIEKYSELNEDEKIKVVQKVDEASRTFLCKVTGVKV